MWAWLAGRGKPGILPLPIFFKKETNLRKGNIIMIIIKVFLKYTLF
jgi:hypothetical protein